MDRVEWNESLRIGVGEIDTQHQRLIDIRNRLAANIDSADSTGLEAFHQILSELFEYSRAHFQAEEDFMRSIDYPETATQRHEHEQFIDAIFAFSVTASKGGDARAEGVNFLTEWLLSHIGESDMKIRHFLERSLVA